MRGQVYVGAVHEPPLRMLYRFEADGFFIWDMSWLDS